MIHVRHPRHPAPDARLAQRAIRVSALRAADRIQATRFRRCIEGRRVAIGRRDPYRPIEGGDPVGSYAERPLVHLAEVAEIAVIVATDRAHIARDHARSVASRCVVPPGVAAWRAAEAGDRALELRLCGEARGDFVPRVPGAEGRRGIPAEAVDRRPRTVLAAGLAAVRSLVAGLRVAGSRLVQFAARNGSRPGVHTGTVSLDRHRELVQEEGRELHPVNGTHVLWRSLVLFPHPEPPAGNADFSIEPPGIDPRLTDAGDGVDRVFAGRACVFVSSVRATVRARVVVDTRTVPAAPRPAADETRYRQDQ